MVLRLGGLYSLERGGPCLLAQNGRDRGEDRTGVLNLLHYDDAAQAVVCALQAEAEDVHGKRFLIVDGEPVTRRVMLEAAVKHPMYAQCMLPRFGEGGSNKKVDGSWSKKVLQWEPKYKSFQHFVEIDAAQHEASLYRCFLVCA